MADKLVLVTGGAGFIGSTIARALIAEGTRVRVFDNLIAGFREVVPPEAEFQLGDLRDPEAITKACEGVDVVYHHAALRSVAKSVDEPLITEECNVMGTLNLLNAAEAAGVRRIVYAASSSAYGEGVEGLNRETDPVNPLSPYAVSKLSGEYYCRLWTDLKGLSTVCLRYFNVFGPGQHPESKYAALFPGLISPLAAGRNPEIQWDGEQTRDFVYVGDVARANLLAAKADGRVDGQVINIGSGVAKSVNEVLATVSKAMDIWLEPVHTPKRQGDVRSTLADVTRAKELLGWEAEADWDEAVAATVGWFTTGAREALPD